MTKSLNFLDAEETFFHWAPKNSWPYYFEQLLAINYDGLSLIHLSINLSFYLPIYIVMFRDGSTGANFFIELDGACKCCDELCIFGLIMHQCQYLSPRHTCLLQLKKLLTCECKWMNFEISSVLHLYYNSRRHTHTLHQYFLYDKFDTCTQ